MARECQKRLDGKFFLERDVCEGCTATGHVYICIEGLTATSRYVLLFRHLGLIPHNPTNRDLSEVIESIA